MGKLSPIKGLPDGKFSMCSLSYRYFETLDSYLAVYSLSKEYLPKPARRTERFLKVNPPLMVVELNVIHCVRRSDTNHFWVKPPVERESAKGQRNRDILLFQAALVYG